MLTWLVAMADGTGRKRLLPELIALFTLLSIAAASALASCGRSLPRELRVAGSANNSSLDGSILAGSDGAIVRDNDGQPSDVSGPMDALGPPDGGDPCAELGACCMGLPGPLQGMCEQVAMGGNRMQCERQLSRLRRFGQCGGDGGMMMGFDGGRRRRDSGPFDADSLGPNCGLLFSCCNNVMQPQAMQLCQRAAETGNEQLCSQALMTLDQQLGITCEADAGM